MFRKTKINKIFIVNDRVKRERGREKEKDRLRVTLAIYQRATRIDYHFVNGSFHITLAFTRRSGLPRLTLPASVCLRDDKALSLCTSLANGNHEATGTVRRRLAVWSLVRSFVRSFIRRFTYLLSTCITRKKKISGGKRVSLFLCLSLSVCLSVCLPLSLTTSPSLSLSLPPSLLLPLSPVSRPLFLEHRVCVRIGRV